MATAESSDHLPASAREFTITRWSVVLSVLDDASLQAAEALEKLCRAYWFPLYAFICRQGPSPHDAQDLRTQAFFARLLEKGHFALAEGERPFRTFPPTALIKIEPAVETKGNGPGCLRNHFGT